MQIYQGNAYRCPAGYIRSPVPYGSPLGVRALSVWQLLSQDPADYDGGTIQFNLPGVPQPNGSTVAVTFGIVDDGSSLGDITIDLQGLNNFPDIATAFITALTTAVPVLFPTPFIWIPDSLALGRFTLFAGVPGSAGNIAFHAPGATTAYEVNGVNLDELDPRFFNGGEFSVPLRIGKIYGFALSPSTPQSQPQGS